jgi:toxin ParE1/3/4
VSRYEIRGQARDDLREIALHIGQDSSETAVEFVGELLAKIAWVAENPKLYRERFEWDSNLRIATHGKYHIIYYIAEEMIEIVRVVHTSRNLEAIMDIL